MAQADEHSPTTGVESPPVGLAQTLRRLGPGLIIAGSIVGSGELIATTKTGAQAGMTLLWLIIVGCLIKVFVQIELEPANKVEAIGGVGESEPEDDEPPKRAAG